jgi:hypothetical protein
MNSCHTDSRNHYYTIPQAAKALRIPSYKLRRAVKLGLVPSYGLLDHRRYVLLVDVQSAMAANGTAASEAIQEPSAFQCVAVSRGSSR